MKTKDLALNIEKTIREDHTAKLTVELEQAPFESAKKRAARQIARRTRIPGFRPGKAPYQVVLRTVGEGTVIQEAMDLLLDEIYPKIIEESELKPYTSGSLDNIISLDPPTLEFTVPLEPVVTLHEYDQIRIPYELETVTDEDVDQVIEDLRDRYAKFETVERAADDGDQVSLRLRSERKNPEEGQEVNLIEDRQTVLTVKSEDETRAEWPFTGFSRHLAGMSAGEEKSFDYTYPEDSDQENLRGTEAIFHIKVEEVKKRELPEVNDEFASTLGEYESLDALREEIHTGLSEQRQQEYDSDYQNQIIDQILEHANLQYPPQMLENELNYFRNQLENRLAQQNLDMDTYLKTRQISEEEMEAELKPSAEQRLKRSLILMEVARQEKIQVDQDAVQNQAMSTLDQIQQIYDPKETRRIMTQDFIQSMIANITSDQMVDSTLDRLTKIAKGEVELEAVAETEVGSEEETVSDIAVETESEVEPEIEVAEQDDAEEVSEMPEIEPAESTDTEDNLEKAETEVVESQEIPENTAESSEEEPKKPTRKRKSRKETE